MPASRLDLGGVSLGLAVALAVYLVVGQPVVSGWNARRVRLHPRHTALRIFGRRRVRVSARMARYHRSMLVEWSIAAVAVALVWGSGGLRLTHLGVRWPRIDGGAAPYTAAGGVCLVLSVAGLVVLARRVRDRGVAVHGSPAVVGLLPRTVRERRMFLAMAVTAGICEELLYRGFILAAAVAVLPGLNPGRAIVVAAAAFGIAHAYQGAAGTLINVVLGACFAVLYLGTGSLLLPILFHILIDLRILILPVNSAVGLGEHGRVVDPVSGPAPSTAARRRHAPTARRA